MHQPARRTLGVGREQRLQQRGFTGPGHSALMRMPSRANWTPSSRVVDSTPHLEAPYEFCDAAAAITAANDPVLMIDPLP